MAAQVTSSRNNESTTQNEAVADTKWLWGFVMHHKRAAILSTVFGVFAGVTSALEPYLVGLIIDNMRKGVEMGEIIQYIALVLGLAVVGVLAFWGQRHYSGEIAYSVNYDIRRVLFDNMLTLDQGFFQRYPVGDLISRMHADLVNVWRLLAIGFTRGGSAIFTLIVAFIILGSTNLLLTMIAFSVLSVSTAFQMRAGIKLNPLFEDVQNQGGVMAAFVQDSVSGIQTIKTTGKEKEAAKKFYEENRHYRRTWLYFKRRNEPVGMLPNMISELTAGVVVLSGGLMTISGQITVGDFTSFLLYLGMISQVLLQLGTVYQRYQQTRGTLARLTPMLSTAQIRDVSSPNRMLQVRDSIVFDHVSLTLNGQPVLRDISLTIPAGKTVAIVGPTGCGKTMLVNLLARVNDPTHGRVLFDGRDAREIALESLRETVAYVPQSTFLFSQELHKNVRMGYDTIDDTTLNDAIHKSRLSNDLPQLPQGLDTLVGEKGVMLSGGQKQRVAIARAIVRDPSVLVLDDAFSSIDMHTAADILDDLRHVIRQRTSIIIAHRIATVKDADFIVVMNEGRIVEQGTHHALIAQDGLYARMVERELRSEEAQNVD